MALTKSDMVDVVHERVLGFSYPREKSAQTVEILLEIIKRTLARWRGSFDQRIWQILCERKM